MKPSNEENRVKNPKYYLVPVGEPMQAGDEFFDVDDQVWRVIGSRFIGKPVAHKTDVIRRAVFDYTGLVRSIIEHVNKLKSSPADPRFFNVLKSYEDELKRRMGEKTIAQPRAAAVLPIKH